MRDALAYMLPALLLLGLLAMRRYPGERTLVALIAKASRCPRRARSTRATPPSRPRVLVPRGGRLIGCALAVRPPPALLAGSHR